MPAVKHPHVDKALRYAKQVVAGKLPAGLEVRQACQRFLDDLDRAKTKGWPYRLDKTKAEKACCQAELLPHIKGEWALRGEFIHLEPWQCFIKVNVYGWVKKSDGFRRFLIAYEQIPRKNSKSTMAATDGLFCFTEDDEAGAEIYSGATSEAQAWEVYGPAKEMVRRSADFRLQYGVTSMAKSMSILATSSRFQPVIGKPGDGASPSCAIVDEYHEHKTPDLFDTMLTGMGARRQPLMIVITTAGFDTSSPCFDLYRSVQQMLSGVVPNDRLFGIVFSCDEGDDWRDPEVLKKANPNFGVSVGSEYLLEQQQNAIRYPSRTNAFKTKHLDMWVSARSAWLSSDAWRKNAKPGLTLEDLVGWDVFPGIDLASKSDIAAVSYVGKKVEARETVRTAAELLELTGQEIDGELEAPRVVEICRWRAIVRSYLPEGALERAGNNRANYEKWRAMGCLTVTDGDELDFAWIEQDVLAAAKLLRICEIGYDAYRATQLGQNLRALGLEAIEIPQATKHLSPPMREIETAVLALRFDHADDECFTWQMSNVVCREDANRNIFPRKENDENKIDAGVATILGVARGMLWLPPPPSAFADRAALGLPPLEGEPAPAPKPGPATDPFSDRAALGLPPL